MRNTKNNSLEKLGREEARYQKVFDGRKQPMRGLWRYNGKFHVRLTVEEHVTGKKEVQCVPLAGTQAVSQAQVAFRKNRENEVMSVDVVPGKQAEGRGRRHARRYCPTSSRHFSPKRCAHNLE